jgi:hypothetical protein
MQKDFTVADAYDEPGRVAPVTIADAGLSLEAPRCWPSEGQGCCRAAVPSVDQQFSVMDRLPQGGEADPSGEAASKSNFDICELTAG